MSPALILLLEYRWPPFHSAPQCSRPVAFSRIPHIFLSIIGVPYLSRPQPNLPSQLPPRSSLNSAPTVSLMRIPPRPLLDRNQTPIHVRRRSHQLPLTSGGRPGRSLSSPLCLTAGLLDCRGPLYVVRWFAFLLTPTRNSRRIFPSVLSNPKRPKITAVHPRA